MVKQPSYIYQIKITLDNTHPSIWRRILVPGNTNLLKLHDIVQIVMGWQDYHLHMYAIKGLIYGDPANDDYGEIKTLNEANYTLNQVIYSEGQRFSYEYDFGDSWKHTLLVEKILPPKEDIRYPFCLKGKRSCPPEDVGGAWGYANFLKAIQDPSHDEHEQYLEWVGGEFDPEAFNLEAINTRLRSIGRGRSIEVLNAWFKEETESVEKSFDLASPWSQALPDDQRLVVENLPLRRDMITLLTYLRENKVTGTQSTGNLPLKAVKEICAHFVNPPKSEETIGELVFRVHSEIEVWPLYFRHVLASVGGLITGGLGRRWKVTPIGEHFMARPAPLQVWFLYVTWWTQINWAIASPYIYDDGQMPAGFAQHALKHLLENPTDDRMPFDRFADQMIEKTGMVWPIQDQDNARRILHKMIEWTLINPQVDFGVLQAEYEPHKTFGMEFRELSTFRITPFGKGLLEAIRKTIEVGTI